jgi:hypothetical protein
LKIIENHWKWSKNHHTGPRQKTALSIWLVPLVWAAFFWRRLPTICETIKIWMYTLSRSFLFKNQKNCDTFCVCPRKGERSLLDLFFYRDFALLFGTLKLPPLTNSMCFMSLLVSYDLRTSYFLFFEPYFGSFAVYKNMSVDIRDSKLIKEIYTRVIFIIVLDKIIPWFTISLLPLNRLLLGRWDYCRSECWLLRFRWSTSVEYPLLFGSV